MSASGALCMHHCDIADMKRNNVWSKKDLTDQEVVENVVDNASKAQLVNMTRQILERIPVSTTSFCLSFPFDNRAGPGQ